MRFDHRPRAGVLTGLAMLAAAACALLAPRPLQAQPGAIPGRLGCETAALDTFNAEQKKRIQSFAESGLARLRDTDPAVSSGARDELLEPLGCASVSVGFRIELGRALEADLLRLSRGDDLRLAANALLIMGKVKSTSSISVLEESLKDTRPAIRLASAAALKVFLSPPSAGLPDRSVEQVLESLGAALGAESAPLVAESIIAALDAARTSEALRSRANSRLVGAVTARLRGLRGTDREGAWAPAIIRAVNVSRSALIQQLGVNTVDREYARRAGVMSALALAYVRDRLPKVVSTSEDQASTAAFFETCEAIVIAAEGQIVFAHTPATGESLRALDLGAAFKNAISTGDAADFNRRLDGWIGPGGLFTKPPYSVPAADLAPGP